MGLGQLRRRHKVLLRLIILQALWLLLLKFLQAADLPKPWDVALGEARGVNDDTGDESGASLRVWGGQVAHPALHLRMRALPAVAEHQLDVLSGVLVCWA